MPPVIIAVVAAAGYLYAYGMTVYTVVMAVVMVASAAASYALQSKAKAPGYSSLSSQRMVTVRDSVRAREIVYGRVRKGGAVAFIGAWDNRNWLTMVIMLAGHEVEAIDEIFFDDDLAMDANGVVQPKWINNQGQRIWIHKHLGHADQPADPILMQRFPAIWTADHRLRGIAYISVHFYYVPDMFRTVPNITAIVRGKKVYDPRTTSTAYSTNPALCIADALTDTRYGIGATYADDIESSALAASATLCDEQVDLGGNTEARYAANGILSSAETPQSNLEMLLSGMAGRLIYTGGTWIVKPGAYEAPVLTLDAGDFRGRIQVQTRQQRRDLCNAVRGVFVSPDRSWQLTDFPPVVSAVFRAQDNDEQIWRDVELPFTTSTTMAQRLAKIDLYASREQISLTVPCSLKALQVRAGDTVAITHARFGWTAKPFLVTDWTFRADGGGGAPVLGCELQLRETSAAVYDFTATEYQLLAAEPDSALPSPFLVSSPGVPTVTESLYSTRDGAGVKILAAVAWAASPDAFVTHYQVEARYLGPETEETASKILGTTPDTTFDWLDVEPGRYEVRVKAVNDIGASSEYATQGLVEVYGLLAPPAAVTGLTLSAMGGLAVLRWTRHPDLDVRTGGYITFRHSIDDTTPAWDESVSIGQAVPGSDTVAVLPLKPGAYLVKAVDSSGVQSRTAAWAATDGATVLAYANLDQIDEHTTFTGDHDGTVAVDDILKLDALGDMDDWTGDVDDLVNWDASSGIMPSGTYDFAGGFDFGTKSRARLRTEIEAVVVNELALLDLRGESVDSWQDWDGTSVADADCQVWYRTTDDDPAGVPTWSAWQRVDSAEVYCRGVDLQARLSATDSSYNINVSVLTVYADELA